MTTTEVMLLLGRTTLGSARGWLHVHRIPTLYRTSERGEGVHPKDQVLIAIANMPRGPYRNRTPRPQRRETDATP